MARWREPLFVTVTPVVRAQADALKVSGGLGKPLTPQIRVKLNQAKDEINNLCNKCIKNLDTFRQGELKKLELLQGTDFCCNFSKFYCTILNPFKQKP